MEIVCIKCKGRFRLSEERLPADRAVCVKCPKCETKIEIEAQANASSGAETRKPSNLADEIAAGDVDFSEKPFDYLPEGIRSALLCEADQKIREQVRSALEELDFRVVEAMSARQALRFMRFHSYDLVVVDERFDIENGAPSHVLQYLSQLPAAVRRETFVVLLGQRFRTMDRMVAFVNSVNLTFNLKDLGDLGSVLKGALEEHEDFYRVLRDALKRSSRLS